MYLSIKKKNEKLITINWKLIFWLIHYDSYFIRLILKFWFLPVFLIYILVLKSMSHDILKQSKYLSLFLNNYSNYYQIIFITIIIIIVIAFYIKKHLQL